MTSRKAGLDLPAMRDARRGGRVNRTRKGPNRRFDMFKYFIEEGRYGKI